MKQIFSYKKIADICFQFAFIISTLMWSINITSNYLILNVIMTILVVVLIIPDIIIRETSKTKTIVEDMKPKLFYRVANNTTEQGLWYDFNGNFTGLIHSKFNFCMNNQLPMPFDENIVGWLSVTETLDDLLHWFSIEDILKLQDYGYSIVIYEATEYKPHHNHWVIKQENSTFKYSLFIS